MVGSYESFKMLDDVLLKKLCKKHKKEWRRKIELFPLRYGLVERILYGGKFYYEINWDVFEKAKRELYFQIIMNDRDSLKQIIRQVVKMN